MNGIISDIIISLLKGPVLAGQVRHLMTVVAGALVGVGALQSDQQSQFISIGSGIVVWLVAAVWSGVQKNGVVWLEAEKKRLEMLLAIKSKPLTPTQQQIVAQQAAGTEATKQ
jgi:hypothetical protein